MAPNGSVLPTGHTWLDIIWLRVLKWFLALLTGGGKHWPVDVVITDPLPACTYANGTSGSGATLTANANAIFPTRDGVAPFVNMLVLVTNESLGALNWKSAEKRAGKRAEAPPTNANSIAVVEWVIAPEVVSRVHAIYFPTKSTTLDTIRRPIAPIAPHTVLL